MFKDPFLYSIKSIILEGLIFLRYHIKINGYLFCVVFSLVFTVLFILGSFYEKIILYPKISEILRTFNFDDVFNLNATEAKALLIILGSCATIFERIGKFFFYPLKKDLILDFLNCFKKGIFKDSPTIGNRVTLFKIIKFPYVVSFDPFNFFSKYLIAEERAESQEDGFNSSVIFRIPKSPKEKKINLGIAGRAVYKRQPVFIDNLPDVSSKDASDQNVKKYARKTYTSEEWVRKERPVGRSFFAFHLETKEKSTKVALFEN